LQLLAVLLIFLPSEIYRAKLEEKLLSEKFGDKWIVYKNNTSFFIPFKSK
jgi:protein-S-isoprenylcysteine O-methyltransferase Ste14